MFNSFENNLFLKLSWRWLMNTQIFNFDVEHRLSNTLPTYYIIHTSDDNIITPGYTLYLWTQKCWLEWIIINLKWNILLSVVKQEAQLIFWLCDSTVIIYTYNYKILSPKLGRRLRTIKRRRAVALYFWSPHSVRVCHYVDLVTDQNMCKMAHTYVHICII